MDAPPSGPDRRRKFKPTTIPEFTPEGSLGRVTTSTGRVISARLMENTAALVDGDPTNDVDATLSDVAEVVDPTETSGGRRKLRGGGKTYDALKKLFEDGSSKFATATAALDSASALAIEKIPTLLKTAAAGGALKYTLNNPSLFANIAGIASEVGKILINTEGQATWTEYWEAGKSIGGSFAGFLGDAVQQPTTPAGSILLALFIMKARAHMKNKSILDVIKTDAANLAAATQGTAGNLASAAVGQYSEFLKAFNVESQRVNADQLKSIANKLKNIRPKAATGEPAFRSGPGTVTNPETGQEEGVMQAVPGRLPVLDPRAALNPLTRVGGPTSRFRSTMVIRPRQGGKKTKKVKSKRRQTRRRKAPKYLAAPVFVY
jgi:hypothetical protein